MKKLYFIILFIIPLLTTKAQQNHPKLLFNSNDIDSIKTKIESYTILSAYYNDLRNDAENHLNNKFYNDRYKMHYASDMAFMYLIEDTGYVHKTAFRDTSINSLDLIYDYAINNSEDNLILFAATLHISLVYDLLYSEMEDTVKYKIAKNIKSLVDSLYNKMGNAYGNNHSAHAHSGIGIGILSIKGDTLDNNHYFTDDSAQPYIDTVNILLDIIDKGMFTSDGSYYEGAKYGAFAVPPIVAYYEMLSRDSGINLFQNSNLKRFHEWLINELIPAEAHISSINDSLFDFNPINASFNWECVSTYDWFFVPSRCIVTYASLGGIYDNEVTTARAATWLFEHHLNILLNNGYRPSNYFGSSNILTFIKYLDNTQHPDNIPDFPKNKFFLSRGLIVREDFKASGTLFSFETNHAYNPETGKCHNRWDEDDNNSFTFFTFGERWIVDGAQKREKSSYHSTVLIDEHPQPYTDINNFQVTNWYDYHNGNEFYYIISDITDAWKKKVHGRHPTQGWCSGLCYEVYYIDDDRYPSWSTSFVDMARYRRYAQFVKSKDSIPAYVIIYDDINVDSTYHNYTFLLHTGSENSLSSFKPDSNKIRIIGSNPNNVMDVYLNSTDSTLDFSTSTMYPIHTCAGDPHERLEFESYTVNPHFHAILLPKKVNSSLNTNISYNNLNSLGSLALIEFLSEDITDYSLYSYKKSLDYNGYKLEGYSEPNDSIVSGVMSYCRKDNILNETTCFFMSRGSYLEMDSIELVSIGGGNRAARVVLNNNKIIISRVTSNSNRYSYKVYGPDVNQIKIGDLGILDYTVFNKYNYINSEDLITNYSTEIIDSNLVRVSWNCPEAHESNIFYWSILEPDSIYSDSITNNTSGYNHRDVNIELNKGTTWIFRLEAKMNEDNYIDLSNPDTSKFDTLNPVVNLSGNNPDFGGLEYFMEWTASDNMDIYMQELHFSQDTILLDDSVRTYIISKQNYNGWYAPTIKVTDYSGLTDEDSKEVALYNPDSSDIYINLWLENPTNVSRVYLYYEVPEAGEYYNIYQKKNDNNWTSSIKYIRNTTGNIFLTKINPGDSLCAFMCKEMNYIFIHYSNKDKIINSIGGGCPILQVYTKTGYKVDNSLLPRCKYIEQTYNDRYILKVKPESRFGEYKFRIVDNLDTSLLDRIKLYAVDYPLRLRIGIASDGKVIPFSGVSLPISGLDNQGKEWVDSIRNRGKSYYRGIKSINGILTVNFGKKSGGYVVSAAPPPKESYTIADDTLYTRMRGSEYVTENIKGGKITCSVLDSVGYIDFVAMIKELPDSVVNIYEMSHKNLPNELINMDSVYYSVSYGDTLIFNFNQLDKEPPLGYRRDYIIDVVGYYTNGDKGENLRSRSNKNTKTAGTESKENYVNDVRMMESMGRDIILEIESENERNVDIKVYDIMGRIVSKESLNLSRGVHRYTINELPIGIYFIRTSENIEETYKITILK